MVFFTCDACGESLKKAQVEKHVSHCRNCRVLCCIDCGKDFWGDDYKSHVRCISEDQKYGGKGFEAKANKGDVKQQQWLQRVHTALSRPDLSSSLQNVLKQVAAYDNVPRKKAKFQNWMRSSLRISSSSLQEEVWNILSAEAEKDTPPLQQTMPPQTTQQTAKNGEIENGVKNAKKTKLNKQERREARRNGAKKDQDQAQDQDQDSDSALRKKERKRKHRQDQHNETGTKKAKTEDETTEDPEEEQQQEEQEEAKAKGKFNWKGNIRALLRDTDDQELSVKKLRKKVLAAYYSFCADSNHKSQEEVLALFNKKINNNPKFRVLKDKVKLVK